MTRQEVFARDGHRCVFCGQVLPPEELTVDHLQARSRGGDRSGGNLVTACRACNGRKGRRQLAEFLASEPGTHRNFRRYATHAWKRHLRALEEEIRARATSPAHRTRRHG
jgi:5-methylcytosine-specific restriction endonuclease McrA